jgi:hypothetical protein
MDSPRSSAANGYRGSPESVPPGGPVSEEGSVHVPVRHRPRRLTRPVPPDLGSSRLRSSSHGERGSSEWFRQSTWRTRSRAAAG